MNTVTHPMESHTGETEAVISVDGFPPSSEEAALVQRLRNRDEAAFLEIVQRHHGSLVRLAQSFVNTRAVAEEVAQETWVAVLEGIDRFEGRSALKTWIFQILINRSKTRGVREARSVNFSAMNDGNPDSNGPSVDPSRFFADDDSGHPGGWVTQPREWELTPERLLLSEECRTLIEAAIAGLPELQKQVITLKDVQGWENDEICAVLGMSEGYCRVVLHRGRSRIRQALEHYLVGPNRKTRAASRRLRRDVASFAIATA